MRRAFSVFVFTTMIGIAFNSYADGFYVIPAVKERIVEVEVQVCNDATSIGANAFVLDVVGSFLSFGKIFSTTNGKLVEITGVTPSYDFETVYYSGSEYFRVAPITLPAPAIGVKGPFYYLHNGEIAYAKYL